VPYLQLTDDNYILKCYHQAENASERFGYSRYVDPSPGLTGPAGQYHQAASLVAVPDGQNAGTTLPVPT
jgi:hypothetical protein